MTFPGIRFLSGATILCQLIGNPAAFASEKLEGEHATPTRSIASWQPESPDSKHPKPVGLAPTATGMLSDGDLISLIDDWLQSSQLPWGSPGMGQGTFDSHGRVQVAQKRSERLPAENLGEPVALPDPEAEKFLQSNQSQAFTNQQVATLTVNIRLPPGTLPPNVAAHRMSQSKDRDRRSQGGWAITEQHWAASNLHHRPLYFEEVNLERYGYTCCEMLQPLFSAARFFATIPALPYKMVLEPPCHSKYALGHYRVGSCPPWYWQRLPLNARAGLVEAGWILGLVFLIP